MLVEDVSTVESYLQYSGGLSWSTAEGYHGVQRRAIMNAVEGYMKYGGGLS